MTVTMVRATEVSDVDASRSVTIGGFYEGETGKNEAVVAYEKDAPTNGGYVLLSAGSVKKMTASEFAAAPKAGKH